MFSNIFLLISLLLTRFVGLFWGNGFFFHPDENNMAWAIERLSLNSLNPDFFAYGQFPLYLVYFSSQILKYVLGEKIFSPLPFSWAVYGLRFWSAIFSAMTIVVSALLFKELNKGKKENLSLFFVFLLIFTPGLIQSAHFGTTESILTFVAVSIAYFSIKLSKTRNWFYIIPLALTSAVGLSTKVNSVLFLLAPLVVIFSLKRKNFRNLVLWGGMTLILTIVFSPFNFIKFSNFFKTLTYESNVARGITNIFYTRQFIDTKPIFFQFLKIFPWALGLPTFLSLLLATSLPLIDFFKKRVKLERDRLILFLTVFPWLLFNSFLFVKWTRFMTPALPFLILMTMSLFKKIKSKILLYSVFIVSLLPGILFTKIYLIDDVRIRASDWMTKNIPEDSLVISEAGNVVNLPVGGKNKFEVVNFDFYNLEDNQGLQTELEDYVDQADYILLPSRRIFSNHNDKHFPYTAGFYQSLFSSESDFELISELKVLGPLEEFLLGSDLNSEETWTVFDHPTIRLFSRKKS